MKTSTYASTSQKQKKAKCNIYNGSVHFLNLLTIRKEVRVFEIYQRQAINLIKCFFRNGFYR